MKVIVLILILLAFAHGKQELEVTPNDAAKFIQGFLKGALGQDFGSIEACMTNADKIIADITSIVDAFKGKIDWFTVVAKLGSLLVDLPDAVKNCDQLPNTVVETIKKWGKKLGNILDVIKMIARAVADYLERLVLDGQLFIAYWNAGSYLDSGEKLGDIPFVLFNLCAEETQGVFFSKLIFK